MLRIFLGRFIKADAIKAADDLNKVNIDDAAVQLPDSWGLVIRRGHTYQTKNTTLTTM